VGQISDPYDQGETELGITISGLPGNLLEPDPPQDAEDTDRADGVDSADSAEDPAAADGTGDSAESADADGSDGPEYTDDPEYADEAVVYDLDDWSEIERQAVTDRLREAQIAHAWDGTSLEVSPLDEAAVENVLDIVEGESAPELDDDRDQVAYDMSEFDDDVLDALDGELRAAGIAHAWREEELFVHADDEETVDEVVERVSHPHELAAEPDEGPAGAEVLGDLFVAADRLQHDSEDPDGILAVLDGAETVEGSEPPYGLGAPEWKHLCERVVALSDLLQEDKVDQAAVATSARDLRTALRPFV
jgi:hypothetical protein